MTREEIIQRISFMKDNAKKSLSKDKKVLWSVSVKTKQGDYLDEGTNKDEDAFGAFCKSIDDALSMVNVYTIDVKIYDQSGKTLNEFPTIIINNQDVAIQDEKKSEDQILGSPLMELVGVAFGMAGLGSVNKQFGPAGVLMMAQKQTMEREFKDRETQREIASAQKENEILKTEIAQLKKELYALQKLHDKILKENERLQEIEAEYQNLQTTNGKIASVGSAMLGAVLPNILAQTPIGQLMGFGTVPQQQQQPQYQQHTAEEENLDPPVVVDGDLNTGPIVEEI